MEKEIEKLLNFLCVEWGFCIPPKDQERLRKSNYLDASEFSRSVLIAEGMDAKLEIEWFRKIRNKFIETFGKEVYASDFE